MMKSFLKTCGLWLVLAGVAAIGLDLFLSSSLKQSTSFAEGEVLIWEDIFHGRIQAETLIYGSSRAWVHLNPMLLEEELDGGFYNLGMDGYHFGMQEFRHRQFLKYNRKPRRIILSLDVFSLEKREDLYNFGQFLPYLFRADFRRQTGGYEGFSFWDYRLPLVRYYGDRRAKFAALRAAYPRPQGAYRTKGYRGMALEWSEDFSNATHAMNSMEAGVNPDVLKLFHGFLSDCRSGGIDVLLVYTPEYIEGQRFVRNREDLLQIYRDAATAFQIPFLDYSDSEFSTRRDLFYNAMHLNQTGSDLFTLQFAEDIRDWMEADRTQTE